jgi:hypothetical protein
VGFYDANGKCNLKEDFLNWMKDQAAAASSAAAETLNFSSSSYIPAAASIPLIYPM